MSVMFLPTPALAQYPVPTELSVGLGGVIDTDPTQTSGIFNVGLAMVLVRDQWVEPAIELGLGPTSDVSRCQDTGRLAPPETCLDAYVLAGPRFRPLRDSDRLWRPFVHLLVGAYWKGTGLKNPDLLPGNFALQSGGGIDIRWPESIHGLRLAGDYRRVFAGEQGRHQLQFVASYFVGWRGRERPSE